MQASVWNMSYTPVVSSGFHKTIMQSFMQCKRNEIPMKQAATTNINQDPFPLLWKGVWQCTTNICKACSFINLLKWRRLCELLVSMSSNDFVALPLSLPHFVFVPTSLISMSPFSSPFPPSLPPSPPPLLPLPPSPLLSFPPSTLLPLPFLSPGDMDAPS